MGGCSYCDKKIEMKLTSYEYREKNINKHLYMKKKVMFVNLKD